MAEDTESSMCSACKIKKYEKFLSRRCRELDEENMQLVGRELSDFPESRFDEDCNEEYEEWLKENGWVRHVFYSRVFIAPKRKPKERFHYLHT